MSLRLEMLQVARLSPRALGESADLVAAFLRAQQLADGGFADRSGASDLYYTVFAVDGLIALHQQPPRESTAAYLQSFGGGATLDFVHLACLARAWAAVAPDAGSMPATEILTRVESFRTPDGGYHPSPGAAHGTAYGSFLAMGAYQDCRAEPPQPERLIASLETLRARDGGYGNQPDMIDGQTSATAAVITVRRQLAHRSDDAIGDWLLQRLHAQGGFTAAPGVPLPDLLSTATALHALATLQRRIDPIRDRCLDFVDSLWTNRGGFYGSWADDHLDCEYTYYGLLALGHLAA